MVVASEQRADRGRHVRHPAAGSRTRCWRCPGCSSCWPRCCSRRSRRDAPPAAVPGRPGRARRRAPRTRGRRRGAARVIADGAGRRAGGRAAAGAHRRCARRSSWRSAVAGVAGLLGLGGFTAVELVPLPLVSQLQEYALVAAPLYILLGEALAVSGLGRDLFAAAHRWFTRVPGGLAASAIGSSTLFGAMSGVSHLLGRGDRADGRAGDARRAATGRRSPAGRSRRPGRWPCSSRRA